MQKTQVILDIPWRRFAHLALAQPVLRVLRGKPVYRAISRRGTLSRKYICRILANMPTVITPLYPAPKVSRVVDSVGQFWGGYQQVAISK